MSLKRTSAVVLKIMDHGESDKIVVFYCPALGKLTGIAKGAKRSKKRFVNKLEIFSWLEIGYDDRGRGTLVQIAEADLLDHFITLRQHYDRYVAATLICEIMVCWTRENDADQELFDLLTWAFQQLNCGHHPPQLAVLFQVRLFDILGFRPQLAGCLKCGRFEPAAAPYGFSLGQHGLLCASCHSQPAAGLLPLSLSTVKLLANALALPRGKLDRLRFSAASLQEARAMLRHYGQYILQREIHSWNYLPAHAQSR